MRDQWNTEVWQALGEAQDAMERATGRRPKVTLDQQKAALDIIVPKFTLRTQLEHYIEEPPRTSAEIKRKDAERKSAGLIVRQVWERVRDEHPELWTYAGWYDHRMRNADTRELSEDDFAERMRRKRRNARARQEEAPEATDDEEGAEVEVVEESPHPYDCGCSECIPF